MSSLIAFCGLDCAQCEAYQATQANDPAWQERIVAKWRVEYNAPQMSLKDVACDGCRGPRLGGYCSACPVRACATGRELPFGSATLAPDAHEVRLRRGAGERGLQTCADCPEYACAELEKFFAMAPHARDTLELLRVRK